MLTIAAAAADRPAPEVEAIRTRVAEAAFGKPLITNVLRGQVAEAIVACALEPEWTWCAADYGSWDFETEAGLRLEVKQSAARQSWTKEGDKPARPSFDIASRQGRWEGAGWISDPGRPAQIYVFAYHPIADGSADHRDPRQWEFYVVRTSALPDTQRLSLANLRTLTEPVRFEDLSASVEQAVSNLAHQGSAA